MYHELTYKQIKTRRKRAIIGVIVAVALIAVITIAAVSFQHSAAEQSVASIRNSVLSTAEQCYAIEGSYPSSLQHLEDVYGLAVNHSNYIVYYEWMADNVPPTVTVRVR